MNNPSDNEVIPSPEAPDDPPRSANERQMLQSYLEYYRTVLVRKCADLTHEQLQVTAASSTLTLGRLLRHMALVEDHWFSVTLHGRDPAPEWADADWETQPDWEMDTAADVSPVELAARFDAAVTRSRDAIADLDLDHIAAKSSHGSATSLRWIMIHMIEEYARHSGHADLIREAIDGRTGD